jgi:hypothetical protein
VLVAGSGAALVSASPGRPVQPVSEVADWFGDEGVELAVDFVAALEALRLGRDALWITPEARRIACGRLGPSPAPARRRRWAKPLPAQRRGRRPTGRHARAGDVRAGPPEECERPTTTGTTRASGCVLRSTILAYDWRRNGRGHVRICATLSASAIPTLCGYRSAFCVQTAWDRRWTCRQVCAIAAARRRRSTRTTTNRWSRNLAGCGWSACATTVSTARCASRPHRDSGRRTSSVTELAI